jgi:DNA repair exonuclease SbcCD nuclease subunit
MTANVLIVGDPHLGAGLSIGRPGIGSILNSRIIDQLNILEWVLQQAIENYAGNIIITGDLFEEAKPHISLISLFISWLKQCSDHNINVHLIMGNHDLIRSGQYNTSVLDLISAAELEGIYTYKDITSLELDRVSFTFIPFRDRRAYNTNSNIEALKQIGTKLRYENLNLNSQNIKIAIGHLSIVGSIPGSQEIEDMRNELYIPLEMLEDYDYSFFGHVHRQQVFSKQPYIAHLGSMDISNFGEADQKKVIALIDPTQTPAFKYITIPSRPLKSLSVSVPSNTTDTTGFVIQELQTQKPNLARAIVKLNINLESTDLMNVDCVAVEKCLTDLGAYHTPRIDQTRQISQIKKSSLSENLDNTITELAAIKMYAASHIEKNFEEDFISLAHSIVKEVGGNATS